MKNIKMIGLSILIGLMIIIIPNMSLATRDIVVILDPGHGGSDPGTIYGPPKTAIREKDITWKIANKVKEILDATPGITGILTRQENECPSLYTRGLVAKDWDADLLVSFHINSSSIENSARGAEVYITGDKTEERLHNSSKTLGKNILSNLKSIGIPSFRYEPVIRYSTDGELYENGVLSDYYGIIRNPMYYRIPGVLIEHCFMNHAQDRLNFLSNDNAIYAMAVQDANAIIANKELFRKNYRGDIATEIQSLTLDKNSNANPYIKGEILVTEWIDGVTWSVPRETPKIRIKEVNGTQSYEMWVSKIEGNRYYFDGYMEGINPNKKYEIEVESGSTQNVSPYKKARGYYSQNITLGQFKREILKIENNILSFVPTNYCGDIATQIVDTKLEKNAQGIPYLRGEILITEWIGKLWNAPDVTPEMTIVATDNSSSQQFWVKNIEGNRYYFDGYIDGLDMTKEYVIQVKLKNQYNTSKYQNTNVIYTDNTQIGAYENEYELNVQNGKIVFVSLKEYKGDIATEITNIELLKNNKQESYIKGEIIITEWINGVTWSIPRKIPKIRIKDINGTQSYEMWVVKIEGNCYYFDGYIEGIDTQKEYEIEVESGSDDNVSVNRKGKGYYPLNEQLGNYKDTQVKIENHKIIFEEITYQGDIATEITNLELLKNNKQESYIKGEIIVTEWLNGVTWSIPRETPKIRIKDINGTQSYEMWVIKIEGNCYYFDGYIEGIDTQKEYEIEVESGSKDNISVNRKGKGYYSQNKELGDYKNNKVKIEGNKIKFEPIHKNTMSIEEKQEETKEELESIQQDEKHLQETEEINIDEKTTQEEMSEEETKTEKENQTGIKIEEETESKK